MATAAAERNVAVLVTIGVLTFRRPKVLAVTLPTIVEHARRNTGMLFEVRVLVVDNDPDESALAAVAGLDLPEVTYCCERSPGISAARNRALEEAADSDLLVFIDDDEEPRAAWLSSLLATWSQTRAGLVCGKVDAVFDGSLEPWVASGDFFRRLQMPTGTVIHVVAAGNLLIDLRQVLPMGVRFENRFGLSGGEDNLFSRQLDDRGLLMVWCDESVATDHVPAERMTRRWVLARSFSHGNTAALVERQMVSGAGQRVRTATALVMAGLARLAAGTARWSWGLITGSDRHQARGMRLLSRGAGMVAGALGWVHLEYARSGRKLQLLSRIASSGTTT